MAANITPGRGMKWTAFYLIGTRLPFVHYPEARHVGLSWKSTGIRVRLPMPLSTGAKGKRRPADTVVAHRGMSAMIKQNCILLMLIVASCDKPAATRPATGPTSAPAIRRVHVFITGKVQGVGFRAFTKERADELGVKGWVKNLLDGRVEAVMQGRSEAVEKVLQSVRKGPRSSRVDGVEVKEEKIGREFGDFRVIEGQ